MSGLRKVFAVAQGNLRGPVLDPVGALLIFVVPVVIIAILGLTLTRPPDVAIGVVAGNDPVAAHVLAELESTDSATIHRYTTRDDLELALRRQTVAAGFVVPEGAETDLRAGRNVDFEIVSDPARAYPIAARTIIATATSRVGTAYQAARFAVDRAGADFDTALEAAWEQPGNTELRIEGTSARGALESNGYGYAAPASIFLFMFLNTSSFAAGMVVTRQLGCERRMAATPTRPITLLMGDFLGRYVLAAAQGLMIIFVGSLAFGVAWGNLGGAVVLVLVFAVVSVGAAELIGALASTREQALGVAAPGALALAMLGGCIWPLSIVGPTLQRVARAVPHTWAMDAAQKLQYGLPFGAVRTSLLVLAGFAVALTAAAHTRLVLRLGGR